MAPGTFAFESYYPQTSDHAFRNIAVRYLTIIIILILTDNTIFILLSRNKFLLHHSVILSIGNSILWHISFMRVMCVKII